MFYFLKQLNLTGRHPPESFLYGKGTASKDKDNHDKLLLETVISKLLSNNNFPISSLEVYSI
jgi:hypothetical protein